MDTGLKGRTVLITGASRNMGRIAPLMFAQEGANLVLCAHSSIKELNGVADEARALGVKVLAELCDVTNAKAVTGFVNKANEQFGGVDVVVNLAGYRAEHSVLKEDDDAWNRTIEVNLSGPLHVCRSVLPHMQKQRWGRIINISGLGTEAAKAMVKMGVVGFTRGLAREFGEYNITANCVCPGGIGRKAAAHEIQRALDTRQALRRQGSPEEAVSLMVYLASENAGFITGQNYMVNGGSYFQ